MTAWWAFKASTQSVSLLNGDLGSPTGLHRWHKQYSLICVMILPACSSFVITHRVIWLILRASSDAESSLICTIAFLIVAAASLSSAPSFGSSKAMVQINELSASLD